MFIEIFKADNPIGLKEEVNRWLDSKKDTVEIVQIVQSESLGHGITQGWTMTLTLLYKVKPAGIASQLKAAGITGPFAG